jgi:hypothetical protein
LTVEHSAGVPQGRSVVGLWVRAAEGLESGKAFDAFRKEFAGAQAEILADRPQLEVKADGKAGPMRIEADLEKEERLACEGGEPRSIEARLRVDEEDLGEKILGNVEPVRRYRELLDAAERGGVDAFAVERVFEAENAHFLLSEFAVGEDANAGGGKFVWVPGKPGETGGSRRGRLIWLVHVPEAGAWHLWARVQTPTPSDDSFLVQVQQPGGRSRHHLAWHAGVSPVWKWVRVRARAGDDGDGFQMLDLEKGRVSIEFGCREDGARLDALYLTRDPEGEPPS